MIIENLICNILLLIYGLIWACIGFFIATKKRPVEKVQPPAEPVTEDVRRKIERQVKENENFWNYDGSEQK